MQQLIQILSIGYLTGWVFGLVLFFNLTDPREATHRHVSKWIAGVVLWPIVFPVIALRFIGQGVVALITDHVKRRP